MISMWKLFLFQFVITTITLVLNFIEVHRITNRTSLEECEAARIITENMNAIDERARNIRQHEGYMRTRIHQIRSKCRNSNHTSYWYDLRPSGLIWSYTPKDVHFCSIPKVGCTFWKRFMLFVSGDYPKDQDIQRPTDIDRGFVHGFSYPHIQITEVYNPVTRMIVANRAFMFTRDPYTRLWSAYIDKFLLPDFWISHATKMMSKVRKDPGPYDLKCGNNLSFPEYLTFITMTPVDALNEHFQPMHLLCSPCHVAYDVIGKLEQFTLDSEYVLRRFDLDNLINITTNIDLAREEIRTLAVYNFRHANSILSECVDNLNIANRLWLAFQYNGYIYRYYDFPEQSFINPDFISNPASVFFDVAIKTINTQRRNGLDMTLQKRTMMLEAFRTIPKDLLDKITNVYKYDFELFGYDKHLFHEPRYNVKK